MDSDSTNPTPGAEPGPASALGDIVDAIACIVVQVALLNETVRQAVEVRDTVADKAPLSPYQGEQLRKLARELDTAWEVYMDARHMFGTGQILEQSRDHAETQLTAAREALRAEIAGLTDYH